MKLVDFNNILYIRTFSLSSRDELNKENLLKSILQSLRYYDEDVDSKYGRLIILCDSKTNWRKEYFPYYKIKRKESRENSDIDWDEIFSWWVDIKSIIAEKTTWPILEIDDLEGDDLIALMCRLSKPEKHLIISSDKDFNQLLKKYWIFQFSPLTMKEIERDDLKLKTLILKGDSSDGVPSIFCPDNWFILEEKERAKSITKKIIEEINLDSENYVRQYLTENNIFKSGNIEEQINEAVKNYKRNKLLVDLSQIPEKYNSIFKKEFIMCINKANRNGEVNHLQFLNEWI